MRRDSLALLEQEIVTCRRCPRLRSYCRRVAARKRRAYNDWTYWGKPVPGFGDPEARLLIIGLAPGAHGANRTGRMFTGDASGDFLYSVLFRTGFASQPESRHVGDGLQLRGAYITAAARCAPPDNKPSSEELRNCRSYLARELKLLPHVRVVVALGRIAFDSYLTLLREQGQIGGKSRFVFAHNRVHQTGAGMPWLISSYHPSQQNTATGRLTRAMLEAVFRKARRLMQNTLQGDAG